VVTGGSMMFLRLRQATSFSVLIPEFKEGQWHFDPGSYKITRQGCGNKLHSYYLGSFALAYALFANFH